MNINLKTMSPITILIIIILALLGTIGIIYAAGHFLIIESTGTIDEPTTSEPLIAKPASLEWGTITRGVQSHMDITLTNTGTTDINGFTINFPNQSPGLILGWSGDVSLPIPANGGTRVITIYLTPGATAPTDFSFQIRIDY